MKGYLKQNNIIACRKCKKEKNESNFYITRIEGNYLNKMTLCKNCFIEECNKYKNNVFDLAKILNEENIPFIRDIWENCLDIRIYMKNINSLPQYSKLKSNDNNFFNSDKNEIFVNRNKPRKDGLTDEEGEIMDLLVAAWNKFNQLEREHPSEINDFADGIHKCQYQLAMRILRRDYPEGYPQYKHYK